MEHISFDTRDASGIRWLMVRGDIDMNTAGDFARALDAANGGSVAGVDLTHCGYLDSSAIAVMVRKRAAWGCSFPVIVPEGSFFRRLFDITGVDSCSLSSPTTVRSTTRPLDSRPAG